MLLLLVLLTGAAASPLVVLLAAALVLLVRFVPSPLVLTAPLIAAVILAGAALLAGQMSFASAVVAVSMMIAAIPGLMWRREARQAETRVVGLDDSIALSRRERESKEPDEAEAVADLERALGAVAARVGARNVILWDVDGYHGLARARAASMARPGRPLRLAGDPLGWVWEQGMQLRLDPSPSWARPGLTVIAERLRRNDESGILATYSFEPALMPSDDLVFEEASIYLRGVLALQESRAEAAEGKRRVAALLNGLGRIPGEMDIDIVAADLCNTAIGVTEATGAAVGMWNAAAEHGELLAVAGADGGPVTGDIFEPPASELAIAIRADTMITRDAAGWRIGRTHVARPDERWIARPRALAILPLRGARGTIGVLAVWTSTQQELDAEAIELLHALLPYAALHIEHARAFGRMRETAERDPLTQLRNRRAFDDAFAAETVRFERYGRPLTLLMLDLDHFKAVNDQYGHEAGDEVLRVVAAIIADCVRDVDIPARLGGEEFVVLLPETGMPAALEVAARVRAGVEAKEIRWRGTAIPVTVSIGAASCPGTASTHPRTLVAVADAALYRAKAAGRNRVESA